MTRRPFRLRWLMTIIRSATLKSLNSPIVATLSLQGSPAHRQSATRVDGAYGRANGQERAIRR
jgi:hypothetical protein